MPDDAISFLVADDVLPIITAGAEAEWYPQSTEPHWTLRKTVRVWLDDMGLTRVTYEGETEAGVSASVVTTNR